MTVNQIVFDAMKVAKAKHHHTAEQIAQYNNPQVEHLERVNFERVLQDSLNLERQNINNLVVNHSELVSRDNISLDQLTAEALDASGKYKVLTEMLNRRFGMMSLAVSGQEK